MYGSERGFGDCSEGCASDINLHVSFDYWKALGNDFKWTTALFWHTCQVRKRRSSICARVCMWVWMPITHCHFCFRFHRRQRHRQSTSMECSQKIILNINQFYMLCKFIQRFSFDHCSRYFLAGAPVPVNEEERKKKLKNFFLFLSLRFVSIDAYSFPHLYMRSVVCCVDWFCLQ